MDKLLYINGRFLTQPLTGVQRFAFEISKNICEHFNNKVIILIPNTSIILPTYKYKFIIKKIGLNTGHLWEQIDIPIYLKRKNKPILINLTNSAPICYSNQISTIHDLSVYKNKSWFSLSYRSLYKFLIPRFLKKSHYIITVSNFSKNEIIQHFKIDDRKIQVVHNAVTFDENIDAINKKQSHNADYILFVGSISKRKNLKKLIKAFVQVKNDSLKLKIIGAKENHIKSNIRYTNEKLEFISHVTDRQLMELYKNAKMLVYPSFYEGFGIPILEAMKFKCPVIASDIPVFRELYGDSILYIDPNSVSSILQGIEYILNDNNLTEKLIKLGTMKSKEFSWSISSKKIIELINSI